MTTVIRGVLPLHFGSTLQHAGKGKAEGDADAGEEAALRDLAMLFTDIRGFTAFSEDKSPQKVIKKLNECHELQATRSSTTTATSTTSSATASSPGSTGPRRSWTPAGRRFAIRSAIAAMADAQRREAGDDAVKSLSVGIGISAGLVLTGPVGARERRHFTAIGHRVNLASRWKAPTSSTAPGPW